LRENKKKITAAGLVFHKQADKQRQTAAVKQIAGWNKCV